MLFNEVYGSYYNVIAGILSEAVRGELSKERIRKIIEEKGYLESGISVPKALEKGKWPLIRKDYTTPVRHIPTLPLTTMQKQWMKAVCQDPRVRLFDPPLQDLENVEPLFEPDFFVWFDRHSDRDPYEDSLYKEHFRMVLLALRENRRLRIRYRGRKYRHDQLYIPEKLEYSSKDDKFRLIAHSSRGTPYMIRLASIREVSLAEKMTPGEKQTAVRKDAAVRKETVVLELVDERNALERAMIHFSDLEKETVRLDDTHYRIMLRYRREDETEILIRVLSFGPKVRVSAPESFIHLVRDRLDMQKRFKSCGP